MSQPRLKRVARQDADPETAAIYDHYQRERGNVPNMFRTLAVRPRILATMIAHMQAVTQQGTVPAKLKELAICRVSQMNRCEYCLSSHSQIARKLGYSKQQIDELPDFRRSSDFSEVEKLVLKVSELMTLNEAPLDDATFAELQRHFDDGQIVEILASIGLFNYFNRFNNAVQMEPTATPQASEEEMVQTAS